MKIALILHGGAGTYEADAIERSMPFLKSIFEESWKILEKQGSSAAVLHAVRRLEDHEDYNAGTGSKLQGDGVIRMTASYMDSRKERFSSATNITRVKNPIDVAYLLQNEPFPNLAGQEATEFARARGFMDYDPSTPRQVEKYQKAKILRGGTVGACALDYEGILAAGTSTGGTGMETPGRVSDDASPCGNYCTREVAISATGIGETFIDSAILPRLAGLVEYGVKPAQAFEHIASFFRANRGEGGFTVLTQSGEIFVDFNTAGMRYYGRDASGRVFMSAADPNYSH